MGEKMDPEVKAEWIAALRSGDYRQSKSDLRNEDGYCCLGVLCDLYAKKGEGNWEGSLFNFGEPDKYLSHEGAGVLPKNLARHVGLGDTNPSVHAGLYGQLVSGSLAELNDGTFGPRGLTFDEIADVIEEKF